MKKFFFIAVLLFIMTVFAQAQETPKETTKVSTEINSVVNNLFDKTSEAVKNIADALKVPAEHVYKVLVKQQIVDSITITVAMILFLILSVYFYKQGKSEEWDNESDIVLTVFSIAGFLTTLGLFCDYGLTGFINPEYGAIKEIMSLVS